MLGFTTTIRSEEMDITSLMDTTSLSSQDDDYGDSPVVSDPTLLAPACPYQRVIAAARDHWRDGTCVQLDKAVVHAALRSVIASNDAAVPEVLDYLFETGAPRQSLPGEEPFAVLAARRHEHPAYTEMLVVLATMGYDFETRSTTTGESAGGIVNARAPGMLKLVLKEAQQRNIPWF